MDDDVPHALSTEERGQLEQLLDENSPAPVVEQTSNEDVDPVNEEV